MFIDHDSETAAKAGPPSRFSGTLLDILASVSYQRVHPEVIDDPVYRLRYRAYTREGFMDHNPDEVCVDELDGTANSMCFGVYIEDELVSSLRLHHITGHRRQSPSMKVFPDLLDPMLDAGMSFIDPSRFTADHEASLAYPALPFLTLRLAAMASIHFGVDQCLALVRPEHAAFYKRVFGSEQIGDARAYPGLHFPVCLYGARIGTIRSRVFQRFPFFLSTAEERQQLFAGATGGNGHRIPASAQHAYGGARQALQDQVPL
jgi:hypothetical protein